MMSWKVKYNNGKTLDLVKERRHRIEKDSFSIQRQSGLDTDRNIFAEKTY